MTCKKGAKDPLTSDDIEYISQEGTMEQSINITQNDDGTYMIVVKRGDNMAVRFHVPEKEVKHTVRKLARGVM